MTLAGVPPEEIVQLGLAAVERGAVVFLAYRLFMPVGQAHDRSGMARAALRSFALGGGGVSRESQDAKAVALAEFDLFMLGNDRLRFPQRSAENELGHVGLRQCDGTDEGLISGSDPQHHAAILIHGWSGHVLPPLMYTFKAYTGRAESQDARG